MNPDYSLTALESVPVANASGYSFVLAPDPTGDDLYVLGPIDSRLTPGIDIYSSNGSLRFEGSIAVPDVDSSSTLVFTPDGSLGFLLTCPPSSFSRITAFSRASDGTLAAGPAYTLLGTPCPSSLAISPDGKYIATAEIQIYSIAANGSLTPVLPSSFTATYGQINPGGGSPVFATGIVWDQTGRYLLVSTGNQYPGGIAVLDFSAGTLTQTYYPADPFGVTLDSQMVGTFVYGRFNTFRPDFGGLVGYSLQSGQLAPVPDSPYLEAR